MSPSHLQKLREIKATMTGLGFTGSAIAQVLKVPRSTAYAIFDGKYKKGGLTAALIKRILTNPDLPEQVRHKVIEYATEKLAGTYGHDMNQKKLFQNRLGTLQLTSEL